MSCQLVSAFSNLSDFFVRLIFRFWLYMKLFIGMGMTWIMEIISGIHHDRDAIHQSAMYWMYFTDAVNALQGLWVFLIFVCKWQVYKVIRNMDKRSVPRTNVTRTTRATTNESCFFRTTRNINSPGIEMQPINIPNVTN